MKRTFLFLILTFCAIGLFAQMKVYNDGRVGIRGDSLTDGKEVDVKRMILTE